ncbi:DUF3592 domain-containing protein [Corallococcus sp. AB011P]|nr:DUF3592 domain-containing protein [Corallococcus sp. AB011P]
MEERRVRSVPEHRPWRAGRRGERGPAHRLSNRLQGPAGRGRGHERRGAHVGRAHRPPQRGAGGARGLPPPPAVRARHRGTARRPSHHPRRQRRLLRQRLDAVERVHGPGYAGWRGAADGPAQAPAPQALRAHSTMWLRTTLKAIVTVGTVFGLFLGYLAWRLHLAEQAFLARPTVPGRMLAISVETGLSKSSRYWYVKPRYAYEVDGRSYLGETLSNVSQREFLSVHSQPSAELTAYLARYPVGATVKVHYAPGAPERSVLEVSTGDARVFMWVAGALGLSAVLSACGLLFLFVRSRRLADGLDL